MARNDSAMARIEDLIRTYQGGVATVENKYDPDWMLYLLDQFRAIAIQQYYNPKNRLSGLHYSLLQPYTATKDDAIQEIDPVEEVACGVVFSVPTVIMINEVMDGFGYVGSPNGRKPYRRVRSRIQMHDLMSNPKLAGNDCTIYYMTLPDDKIKILNNSGQDTVFTECCFMQPSQVPGFDIDDDRYPINDSIMGLVKDYMTKIEIAPISATPEDRIADFQSQLSKLKQQIGIK